MIAPASTFHGVNRRFEKVGEVKECKSMGLCPSSSDVGQPGGGKNIKPCGGWRFFSLTLYKNAPLAEEFAALLGMLLCLSINELLVPERFL
jgi:hypothetical protein